MIAIVGPTGTGKSDLALEVAQALDGELIGCDALQVYRRLERGTAKPTRSERERVRHHLVDSVDPETDFTLARFVDAAEEAISEISQRGRVPILVGGTGMYLRGLLLGIIDAPPRDAALRDRLRAIGRRRGVPAMHRWLGRVDPVSASRLPASDRQRVRRALEWWLVARTRWSERLEQSGTWEQGAERYRCLKIGLHAETPWLVQRLEARVDRFLADGLIDEVRGLLAAGLSRESSALKAIGYREVVRMLDDELALDALALEIKTHTRRYAKRQRTWLRGERDVEWISAELPRCEQVALVRQHWDRFGAKS